MHTRQDIINYCLTLENSFYDTPFTDPNWEVVRHKENNKVFAWIFEKDDKVWVNVKCDPQWRDLWRSTYESVLPGWHLNKEYWNSIILDGDVPDVEIQRMIAESYDLTFSKKKNKLGVAKEVDSGNNGDSTQKESN